MDELEAAWNELHEANEAVSRFVGDRPTSRVLAVPWSQYAFDPKERPKVGRRSREWTSIGPSEVRCVRNMARCLRELSEGRVPR